MIRHPDVPAEVSLDFLAKIDRDPPMTWIAQPKYDGKRRIVEPTVDSPLWDGSYRWRAKNRDDAEQVPNSLREAFESMNWPTMAPFDVEWVGPRQKGGIHQLYLFDELILGEPFDFRYANLRMDFEFAQRHHPTPNILLAPIYRNPGLCDRYAEQLTNPISEGLVVRRADSTLIGSTVKCAVNPHWFKVKHKRRTEA